VRKIFIATNFICIICKGLSSVVFSCGIAAKDSDICKFADQGDFIVVTKDADFRDSYFIKRTPKKLIKINLGNIPNHDLIVIFAENINAIQKLNSMPSFLVEIDKDNINLIEME
jgi:predicted nuclease of predicted toxin-antitoxin system